MDREGFGAFLLERELPSEAIEQHISLVERFEAWREEQGQNAPPAGDDVRAFSARLVEDGSNTYDNYAALARYGRFVKSDPLYVAAIEFLDGSEVAQGFYDKVGQALGKTQRDEVFEGIELPPLGTLPTQRPKFTQAVMERLERMVDAEACREILADSLRDLKDEWYLAERTKYQECGDIDEYLARKGQDFVAQLEQLRDEGGLYFTQPITDEVIDFVRGHPEILHGVRRGNVLYEAKIPYMTREYLAETDETLKRYYYCHCPWVRESLKAGDVRVSPTFCQCSAGFHKKSWEVIFGRPLQAEVVETVLAGDAWCKFAIHLPEEALPEAGKRL